MITYAEAVEIVDRFAIAPAAEPLHIGDACGKYLAADLRANCDSPIFDNSSVDGYARRAEDLEAKSLRLVGEVKAGDKGTVRFQRGQTVRIFTGAPIPPDAAAVSMQEDCVANGREITFNERSRPGDFVRPAGEDFRMGATLLSAGQFLGPAASAIAASAGHAMLPVRRLPVVSILTTGSELRRPDEPISPGKIYNSNLYALSTAAELLPVERCKTFHSSDNPKQLFEAVMLAMNADVVVTCGGVSVGDHDLVKEEFARFDVEQRFWSVAIKPGKPVYFGTQGDRLVFGLPGNPVSALITFALFVRPAILKLAGHPDPWNRPFQARLRGSAAKAPGRIEFLRGVLAQEEGERVARVLAGQGSHRMSALLDANCLIHFPIEATELGDGETVEVTDLRWGSGSD